MTRWQMFHTAKGRDPMVNHGAANNFEFREWVQKHLTDFAEQNGYRADPRLDRGVVIRTRQEANNAALVCLGHDAFDEYLRARMNEEVKERASAKGQ